jgi:hypothetical protein
MHTKHYRVGGHLLEIIFVNDGVGDELIPSFRPFVLTEPVADEQPLFTLTVDADSRYDGPRDEVGQFDGSGNNYGVYQVPDGGYYIEISNPAQKLCGALLADQGFVHCRVSFMADEASNRAFALNNSLMMAYAFAASGHQTVLMHASVIRKDGYGYLMTAPSGTGKSTHTFLWYKNIPGCDLMNDDNPVVRIVDGQPIIYGTPWSGKTDMNLNIRMPLGGIVFLERSTENFIHPIAVQDAIPKLFQQTLRPHEASQMNKLLDILDKVLSETPIYRLGCDMSKEAVELSFNTIRKDK